MGTHPLEGKIVSAKILSRMSRRWFTVTGTFHWIGEAQRAATIDDAVITQREWDSAKYRIEED
jgi:hypothetical protein